MSIAAGVDVARQRLRQGATGVACGLALAFEVGVALLERAQGRVGAADRALSGGAFGIALPLLSYFLVSRVCAGGNLREAVMPLARHGLDRRQLALGLAVPPALVAAAFAALGSVLVVCVARGFADPELAKDALTSLWIGLIAGPAYVAAFLGASALGRAGRGRSWLLLADFVLGAGTSFVAFPWPKAHVRNLLGGSATLDLSQLVALIALLGMSFAFLGLGVLRSPR
ncbi:MAG: hypothetical protein EOO73_14190 [Myxococcales bacterium]|nr:MAG: hypothetical protein EOO73_14190 [Myxococcales bacterium]